jgi:phosphoesterase RecJ-like protein
LHLIFEQGILMISAKEKKKLEDLLSTKKKIILTTHTNPDGDAIGSSLAMYHYLVKKGHQVTTVVPNHFPEFLSWLPGVEHILIYEGNAKKVQKSLKAADLIFCLDYNSLKRVGNFTDVLERTTQPKILIDHHIDPEVESFDVCISTTQASSTGELVYEFIDLMGDNELIDKAIAEAIYTGIVTDTGSFSFAANSGKPYTITANLIEKGVDAEKIHRLIYDTFSENRLRLLGFAINDRLTVWDKYHAALIYLTKEDLKKYKYKIGDIEGVVNYPLMMEKVNLSILLTEKDNQIRMSFRSKGQFSVNDLARKHFSGGGHRNAAGGRNFLTINESIKLIKKVLAEYEEELNYKLSYA